MDLIQHPTAGVCVRLLPNDLKLLIKATGHLSRFLDTPELDAEAHHCDAMRCSFAGLLLSAELDFRAKVADSDHSHGIVAEALAAEVEA